MTAMVVDVEKINDVQVQEVWINAPNDGGAWFAVTERNFRHQAQHEEHWTEAEKLYGTEEPVFAATIFDGAIKRAKAMDWIDYDTRPDKHNPSPSGLLVYATNRSAVKEWLLENDRAVSWQNMLIWPVTVLANLNRLREEAEAAAEAERQAQAAQTEAEHRAKQVEWIRAERARLEKELLELEALDA